MAAKKDSSKDASNSGTEIQVLTFTHNEDAVVPDGWEILNVDHDRQMAVTRVTVSRPYDAERTAEEKAAREGAAATPTYPQTAGSVSAPPDPPVTAFAWGSIDTSKVQNQPTVAALPPTIAAQEADTAQAPRPEALVDEVKANTGDEDKTTREAASEGTNVEDSETLKQAAELADEKAPDNKTSQ